MLSGALATSPLPESLASEASLGICWAPGAGAGDRTEPFIGVAMTGLASVIGVFHHTVKTIQFRRGQTGDQTNETKRDIEDSCNFWPDRDCLVKSCRQDRARSALLVFLNCRMEIRVDWSKRRQHSRRVGGI
jgi:hypothetical protein